MTNNNEYPKRRWPISKWKDGKWTFIKETKEMTYMDAMKIIHQMQEEDTDKDCNYRMWDPR